MPIATFSVYATGDTIEASWANDIRSSFLTIDGRTGGDPGGADKWLVSSSSTAAGWVARLTAVLAALGYTPVNKAGDTMSGNLTFSDSHEGPILSGGSRIRDGATVQMEVLAQQGKLSIQDLRDSSELLFLDDDTSTIRFKGNTVWHAGNAAFAPIAQAVPSGAVVWFETLAELTAAGAAWARYTAADGRMLIGAGTTHGQTFVQATDYGSNWTPSSGLGISNSLSASSSVVGVPTSGAVALNQGTVPAGNVANYIHGHPAPTITLSGSVSITGSSSAWIPPTRAGIWGRKT